MSEHQAIAGDKGGKWVPLKKALERLSHVRNVELSNDGKAMLVTVVDPKTGKSRQLDPIMLEGNYQETQE